MRLLLDTHTTIWPGEDDPRLSPRGRELIEDSTNELWFSIASVWEMSIKQSLGKLGLKTGVSALVAGAASRGVRLLPIELSRVLATQALSHPHGDPFDRVLIAQGQLEDLIIVGRDAAFDVYGVARMG